jgi:ribulose-bisphosphate carboxylase large chain
MSATDSISARYWVETPHTIEAAAEWIAGEQSSGTFVALPGETEELKARARAKVTAIERQEMVESPSLPGSRPPSGGGDPARYQRAEITIEFPLENVGPNLPTLLATVCGNLYELSEVSGLKLLDLEVPPIFAERYPGPQFGIAGTRKLAGVQGRPLIGTIIKPSVGLSPDQTAELVRILGGAGIDFIKDDELMGNPPHSPLAERVRAVMREIHGLADQSGKQVMYAFNISDDVEAMLGHHDVVLKNGGTCVMVSLNHVGCAAVASLRRRCQLPIHGHRNGWGMLTRHPALGIAFPAYQKIWRLAGVDHLHVNGLRNKFWEPDESVVASIQSMMRPFLGGYFAMPVVSSGQWGGQAPETYRQTQTVDLMYLAGGGVLAHPQGPAAGVKSLRQCWEAAVRGISLVEYASTRPELKAAIETFGQKKGSDRQEARPVTTKAEQSS